MKSFKALVAALLMGTTFALGNCDPQIQDAVLTGAQGTASAVSQAVIGSFFSRLVTDTTTSATN